MIGQTERDYKGVEAQFMKKKILVLLVCSMLTLPTTVSADILDYEGTVNAYKEDNKIPQTFEIDDGSGEKVTAVAKSDKVTDSCSTMHKIAEQEFTLDDFSCEHLFNGAEEGTEFLKDFMYTIKALNKARETYLETKKNIYWWQMIQLLPSSYNQRRTVVLNYEVLRNACQARKHHKLDEWFGFYKWAESLPYSELILEV